MQYVHWLENTGIQIVAQEFSVFLSVFEGKCFKMYF